MNETLSQLDPEHIIVIPDGNRRHGDAYNIDYDQAYQMGAARCLGVARQCLDSEGGIKTLTFYGSSSDNVERRSADQVIAMHNAAISACDELIKDRRIQLKIVGELTGLPERYGRYVFESYSTRHVESPLLTINIAINYSRKEMLDPTLVPEAQLVIRTGARRHLSGFMPIQSANAELCFLDKMWPQFLEQDFMGCLNWYARQIRLGGE